MSTQKLWLYLTLIIVISFTVLIFIGTEIYSNVPPVPAKVISENGKTLFTGQDIKDGQNVWQSMGGQTVGSIWGHGAYIAPDWTADYLHREAELLLSAEASEDGKFYNKLPADQQAFYRERVKGKLRKNTFEPSTKNIVYSSTRTSVFYQLSAYYSGLFMKDTTFKKLRNQYAIPDGTIKDSVRMQQMVAFFAWATWVCVTERPGSKVTYTNNWPADELAGNVAPASLFLWSAFGVLLLLVFIGLLILYHARNKEKDITSLPLSDPLRSMKPTPSMRAALKYVWIVCLLILIQMMSGMVTAHYGVEGNSFYGFPMYKFLPESVARSWHVQLALFWIATSWLATGLYIAPVVSGYEPRFQKAGVNALFIGLLIVVIGSSIGEWMGVMQKMGFVENFWWGQQGYEYLELGRAWQILLLCSLALWLILMLRALLPALRKHDENRHLLMLLIIASTAITVLYGAAMMSGRQTHLTINEYWRWWIVHLWVEGFFEVFATVVVAFLFCRLGLLRIKSASVAVLFSTLIFLCGAILGTFHHLYFTGTTTGVLALGATFSALEIVPLVLIGYEAYQNYHLSKSTKWIRAYKWSIYCFIAMSFWNFFGAGILGFAINPPIALYYIQGLNITAGHSHASLFGVYGLLGIGLLLFMLRGIYPEKQWNDKLIGWAFWLINIGLLGMVIISMLPIGIMQAVASLQHGYWYARSAEFMQTDTMQLLRWLRIPGDVTLASGEFLLVLFIIGLKTGWSQKGKR